MSVDKAYVTYDLVDSTFCSALLNHLKEMNLETLEESLDGNLEITDDACTFEGERYGNYCKFEIGEAYLTFMKECTDEDGNFNFYLLESYEEGIPALLIIKEFLKKSKDYLEIFDSKKELDKIIDHMHRKKASKFFDYDYNKGVKYNSDFDVDYFDSFTIFNDNNFDLRSDKLYNFFKSAKCDEHIIKKEHSICINPSIGESYYNENEYIEIFEDHIDLYISTFYKGFLKQEDIKKMSKDLYYELADIFGLDYSGWNDFIWYYDNNNNDDNEEDDDAEWVDFQAVFYEALKKGHLDCDIDINLF